MKYQATALGCNEWPVWARAVSVLTSSRYVSAAKMATGLHTCSNTELGFVRIRRNRPAGGYSGSQASAVHRLTSLIRDCFLFVSSKSCRYGVARERTNETKRYEILDAGPGTRGWLRHVR